MNDELMRKISEAMDSEDGIAGDPDLLKAMAETPEASRYAKHLSRLQRWMAAWPVAEPSDADLEEIAKKIEARLGEKFSGDYTRAPDFEEDEELAAVTSGLLHAGDLTKDLPSESLELTMSAITELADRVNEEASAVPLAKIPLKRANGGKVDATLPHLAAPSAEDDLPAKKPALPKVPVPRPAAATLIGNAHDAPTAENEDAREHTPANKPPPPPSGTTGKHAAARDADIKPPAPPKAKDDTGKQAVAKAAAPPSAKASGKASSGKLSADERVSIPVPLAGPRLELIEGGASKRASTVPEPKRGWIPAALAAAAIGLGVIGVGTLMTSSAPSESAPAAATVAPGATPATPTTAPVSPAPSESLFEGAEGQMAAAPPPPGAPPPPAAPEVEAPTTLAAAEPVADDEVRPQSQRVATGYRGTLGIASGGSGIASGGGGGSAGFAQQGADEGAPARARGGAARAPSPTTGAATGAATTTTPTSRRDVEPAQTESESRSTAPAREAPTPAPVAAAPERRASASGPAPETLDRATVQSVMQSVEPAVRACAGERHGTAQVDVVVQGTGRVTSATISGNFQGSPEGSCIARAVRSARFPEFTGEALRFRYPYGI